MNRRFALGHRALGVLLILFLSPLYAIGDEVKPPLSLGGFTLSTTLAEMKKSVPAATFTEVRPKPEGGVIGIRGEYQGFQLYFTPEERGGILFRVEQETVYDERPNLKELIDDLIARYGRPAQAGRDMIYHRACWGACPGNGPKLLFRLKTFHPVRVDHRMTLTLVNTKIELQNKGAYRSANKHLLK